MEDTGREDTSVEMLSRVGRSVVRVDGRRGYALSGVAYADDVVVTTARAVEEETVKVALHDGRTSTATPVGRDPATDLAVLKLEEVGLEPAVWAEADPLRVGQTVFRVGRPKGTLRATKGIGGGVGGAWHTGGAGAWTRKSTPTRIPFVVFRADHSSP